MQLEIVTPEKKTYNGEADEVVVNTSDGQIGILPGHMNLFTKILPGEVIIKAKDKEQFLAITGGFLEVSNNKITILADYAIQAEEIKVDKALEAQKRAEAILKKKDEGVSEEDFAIAQADLRRALLELHVSKRRRHNTVQ
ncbi:MAG: ATP synthase F1 subunit epsilon [Patescibacteria group bacterium]